MRNFKDELINNKWNTYQNKLSVSLINDYDIDNKILSEIRTNYGQKNNLSYLEQKLMYEKTLSISLMNDIDKESGMVVNYEKKNRLSCLEKN